MPTQSSLIMYQTDDGLTKIEVTFDEDTVWLTQEQMGELFQTTKSNVNMHIGHIFEEGELEKEKVLRKFRIAEFSTKPTNFYSLDVIISVGYRVKSLRGTQFRIWANSILKEYLQKGFALNDELLKSGGGNYFDELLERIRNIRSSEKIFYRKVLDIYATSIDYDPHSEITQSFFATLQNKMHFSAHGHTAAEIIYSRADAERDFMGLTSWTGRLPKKNDAEYAKNYLSEDELDTLNRIVTLYLDFAELQAKGKVPMYMKDWAAKLDDFMRISGRDVLVHAGKISTEAARSKADTEYNKFKKRTQFALTPVEQHFLESLEQVEKKLLASGKKSAPAKSKGKKQG
jgi:hypothetical protein